MTSTEQVAEELRNRESLRWQLTVAGDYDGVEKLMRPNARYVHSSAHVDDRDSFLKLCRDGVIDYHAIDYDIESIVIIGSVGVVGAHMSGSLTAAGSLRMIDNTTTATWIHEDGQWYLLAFQATGRPAA